MRCLVTIWVTTNSWPSAPKAFRLLVHHYLLEFRTPRPVIGRRENRANVGAAGSPSRVVSKAYGGEVGDTRRVVVACGPPEDERYTAMKVMLITYTAWRWIVVGGREN
jgi:hypothetical protein